MNEKYGSLLYLIGKTEEELAKVRASANLMNEERGKIMEIPKRISEGGWLDKNEGLSFASRLEGHFGGSSWRKFDKQNEKHIEEALNHAELHFPKCLVKAEELHNLNIPVIENNKKCRENIANFLTSYGIRRTKYISQVVRRQSKSIEVSCEWINEINSQIPINDGYSSYVSGLNSKMEQIKKDAENFRAEINKIKIVEDKKLAESKELAEALILYKEQNWATEGLSSQEILDIAEDFRRAKWIKENYPDGTALSHSSCDSCSTWTVGENRCECGSRRMSLCVDKNGKGEYYAYPEPN